MCFYLQWKKKQNKKEHKKVCHKPQNYHANLTFVWNFVVNRKITTITLHLFETWSLPAGWSCHLKRDNHTFVWNLESESGSMIPLIYVSRVPVYWLAVKSLACIMLTTSSETSLKNKETRLSETWVGLLLIVQCLLPSVHLKSTNEVNENKTTLFRHQSVNSRKYLKQCVKALTPYFRIFSTELIGHVNLRRIKSLSHKWWWNRAFISYDKRPHTQKV